MTRSVRFAAATFILSLGLGATSALAAPLVDGWLGQIGGKGADVVFDVVETSDKRLCATGTFWNGSQFGDGERSLTLTSDAAHDIFVACYSRTGRLEFAKSFGSARGDEPHAIAALPGGDVVVTGLFAHGFGDGANKLQANGIADIFIARINARGETVWSRQIGGKLADSGNALDIAADGSILLAGNFSDTLTWRAGGKVPKVNSAGARDAAVVKLTQDGDIVWLRRFGGKGYDEATALAARPDGGLLVAGTFRDDAQFGDQTLKSAGFRDVFVAALTADGSVEWVRRIGGDRQDTVHGLAVDRGGRVHVAGNFQHSLLREDGTTLNGAGSTDVFVARFDADGASLALESFGGALTDQVFALDLTDDGELVLVGHYQGDIDIAPGADVVRLTAPTASNSSAFLLVLDANGKHQRSDMIGGAGMEMAFGVQALADGGIAMVGLFNADVGIAKLTPLDSRGKTDVFVLRLPGPAKLLSNGRTPGGDIMSSW